MHVCACKYVLSMCVCEYVCVHVCACKYVLSMCAVCV